MSSPADPESTQSVNKPAAKSSKAAKADARSNMPAQRRKARHYAMQALYSWQMAQQALGEIETTFRAEYDFSHTDIVHFNELLHEIPAQLTEIQDLFEPHLDRALSDLDPIELTLLRMGAYELSQRVDVPYKVVINEMVSLAKRFGATDSFRYINGVLEKVAQATRQIEIQAERKTAS